VERHRLDVAEEALVKAVDAGHVTRPLDRGIPLQPLRARLGVGGELADWVIATAVARGRIALAGGLVSRAGGRSSADDRVAIAVLAAAEYRAAVIAAADRNAGAAPAARTGGPGGAHR
jgi:hypothetical protein